MKRILLLPCLLIMAAVTWAQGPYNSRDYYQPADGKKGEALKTALCGIIYNRTERSYDQLWTDFRKTDKRDDGKVWDMYSGISNYIFGTHQAGNYSGEGEENGGLYNREHSFPKSWFGASQTVKPPMYTDLFHLYPTDGYVNGMRSNYPFGETKGESYKSANGFSKLGSCTYPGYTGKVFEPNDIYKGDFARTYFYMVTCYEEKLPDWYANYSESKPTLDGNTYPGFQTWQLNMLMTWAANDQVSDKEYNRNIAVYDIQKNRNPFIDYQGLEQYIWGSMKDEPFSYDNYKVPENYTVYIPGDGPGPDDPPGPLGDGNVYKRVNSIEDLEVGAGYIIVCESKNMAMAEHNSTNSFRTHVSLTTTNGAVTTEVNKSGKPYELTLGTYNGKYTLYDATDEVYLSQTSKNNINAADKPSANGALWTISFNGNNAVITSSYGKDYTIQYNSGSPRFACYTTSQNAVQLYKRQPVSTGITTEAAFPVDKAKPNTIIYDLQGRKVGTTVNGTPHLKKGVYIMSGRKVIAK
ncbi:MAG: endonuclease [Prevotella sp.]|nr:endonuclease [Prevotella sp.]